MGPDVESPEVQFDVFLSHNSKDKPAVVELARLLGDRGLKIWLDMWELPPGSLWVKELEKIIRTVKATAVLVGKDGLGPWQDQELQAAMVQSVTRGMVLVPVILPGAPEDVEVTPFMGIHTWLNLRSGFTEEGIAGFEWGITGKKPDFARTNGALTAAPRLVRDYFSSQWPNTDPEVFGRENELDLLDEAWDEGKLNIVTLVAAGGVGKTALVNRWAIYHMTPDGWRGAERVFAWSFYSQGSTEGRYSSSDIFLAEALRWFGDEECAGSALDPYNKGQRLAELVREKRTLLLLDGAEPLQEPPGAAAQRPGQIQDMGLRGLLKSLAFINPGLCVISTRMEVADLKSYSGVGGTALSVDLDDLAPESGMAYLKSMGVCGRDAELLQASKDFGNNALALTLLGPCLVKYHNGDVRRRKEIADLFRVRDAGRHARGVMAWYATLFESKPEGELLNVIGLFDRPFEFSAITAILRNHPIEGFSLKLRGLLQNDLLDILENLRELRLVGPWRNSPNTPGTSSIDQVNSHALVQEFFGNRMKSERNESWKSAHLFLYRHYIKSPSKDFPDSVEEMAPLFQAITHGCSAELYQEVFDDVYYSRIHRGARNYCGRIGAIGEDTSAVANFFDEPWSRPVDGLRESCQAFVLAVAGLNLRTMGRTVDALAPTLSALKVDVSRKDWANAARQYGNLSELTLTMGQASLALSYAKQSVQNTIYSGDTDFLVMASKCWLGNALCQSGQFEEATRSFSGAETWEATRNPKSVYLISVQGYWYSELNLSRGEISEALRRSEFSIRETCVSHGLLSIGSARLALGKVSIAVGLRSEETEFTKAKTYLDEAVSTLRKSASYDFLPIGLLARSSLFRIRNDFALAIRDIDEAWEVSTYGAMRLAECDIHLECARVHMAMVEADEICEPYTHPPDSPFRLFLNAPEAEGVGNGHFRELRAARAHLDEAGRLIDDTGYHRRDPELLLETARLEFLEGQIDAARATLARAKARVDEMGAHGLDFDLRALEKQIG